jgi:hypothetical protein
LLKILAAGLNVGHGIKLYRACSKTSVEKTSAKEERQTSQSKW